MCIFAANLDWLTLIPRVDRLTTAAAGTAEYGFAWTCRAMGSRKAVGAAGAAADRDVLGVEALPWVPSRRPVSTAMIAPAAAIAAAVAIPAAHRPREVCGI
ncbi:hypothetical protein GCM10023196_054990 [Actinoallomurus vinaceus]|uniref:Uncharacterized protein n=1 Tax=Actinoallomurus vinaceus TaxID=1080074 RepID=A0ABP8UFR9_9ACTN